MYLVFHINPIGTVFYFEYGNRLTQKIKEEIATKFLAWFEKNHPRQAAEFKTDLVTSWKQRGLNTVEKLGVKSQKLEITKTGYRTDNSSISNTNLIFVNLKEGYSMKHENSKT